MKHTHMKKKSLFSTVLSLLIAVIMLLTLPGFSTLADTDSAADSVSSSASSDAADEAASANTAAAALVGSSDTSVSPVENGYYRIYYSQTVKVDHSSAKTDFTDANSEWNSINEKGNVYVNVDGTVSRMNDTDLTLTSHDTAFKVYYCDIPVDTSSLFFLCEDTPAATNIKTRTNTVNLTWTTDGALSAYTVTRNNTTSAATSVSKVSHNCFYASNPDDDDWFYQVGSNSFNPVSSITLADTAVAKGEEADVSATITPSWITADDLIWSTENASVATVSTGGKVTGVSDGTTTITAVYGDVTASCTVTVTSQPSIILRPDPASVKVGETITFTPTITPATYQNNDITWAIGNTTIAKLVADGKVEGLQAGETTVTASFTADSQTYSATVNLTVTSASETVTSIALSPTSATIQTGKTQQLTATVTPAGTSSVTWSSNNTNVATVDQNGLVTGIKAGTATITATAAENSSITAIATIHVTASTTLYYLVKDWSGVWVYFYKDNTHKYNELPTAQMTKLNASDYLADGSAIDETKYALYAITVPDTNADYAIFASESGKWTNQDPAQNAGGRATAPSGKNGYYNGNGTAVLVTRKLPTGLAVTPDTSTIASNQTVQMMATATYSDASKEDISGTVTWTSSDPTVATVSSNGLVTAVKEGTVTITASVPGGAVNGTAKVTVKNAAPTKITLTPSESSLLVGTTATLTPSYKPANVNESLIKLKWKSSDEKVATVDEDGVVTAVSKGTTTITASYGSVSATAAVTVSENSSRIYYYAALSKLDYTGSASGPNSIPAKGSDIIYAWVWKTTPSDGKQITLSKLGKVSGNDITYADGDIYYADDVVGTYSHIVFASGQELSYNNLGFGYGQGTAQLTIPSSVANPCFYAGSGDGSVYSNAVGQRPGYWASLFTVFDPEKVNGSDPVYVATAGTKPATDVHKNGAGITYVSSTLYDYYSDYELNGKEVSTNANGDAQVSQRNWVTFREFDQALSDYYRATGKTAWTGLAPIYTGHFQPDELKGTKFSAIASTLGLYGWATSGETYRKFMSTENSNLDIKGNEGQYAKASQGLVSSALGNYQDGSLGTGVLLMDDNSTYLPHFNRQFLEGGNSKNAVLGSVYDNVAFPFTQETDPYYKDVSYYTFDSARESVYLKNDTSTGEKYLEDVGTDAKSKNVNSSSATSGVSTTYGYFPFNEDSISENAKTYDYGFGTKLEFQFTLNKNGDVNSAYGTNGKAPTIFKFSGDDDVWVFIDGKLVLDLGGSHGQVEGAINFSSDLSGTAQYPSKVSNATVSASVPANSVWVSGTKATAGTATPYNLSSLHLQDGKKHTLTLYYMERGMWESNMMIQFNMSIEKTLTVKKDWKNYDGTDLADSKKTTVYAAVKRSLPNGTPEFVKLTGSEATDGSQYLIPLTSANQWTQTFSVDEYRNGAEKTDANKYTYYLYEVQVDPSGQPVYSGGVPALYSDGQKMMLNGTTYQVSGTGAVTGTAGTITNTRQKGSGVTITKAWSGTSSDEMKPANVYVVLHETTASGAIQKVTKNESGKAVGNESGVITLNSGNNWTASVEDLRPSSSYTFKEVTDDTGTKEVASGGTITLTGINNKQYQYTVSGGAVTNGAVTITNTFSAPKTQISITKSWVDESGHAVSDGLPDTVYVKLKRTCTVNRESVTQYRKSDGTFTEDQSSAGAIQLSKSENWTTTISDLDVYADIVNQTVWTYSLFGEAADGAESGNLIRAGGIQYVVSYGTSFDAANKSGALTVTNTKLPQTSLTVKKVWQNSDGHDISESMSQDVAVYLKRYTLNGTTEENVGYYKVDEDGKVSFDAKDTEDATQITLTKASSYKAEIDNLDVYLTSVETADDGKQTLSKTPWHFVLTDETSGDAKADTELLTGKPRITIDSTKYDVSYSGASGEDTSPTVTVTNKAVATYTLPGTGGRGRNMLLGILGGAATLAAVLYWNITRTRRRRFKK